MDNKIYNFSWAKKNDLLELTINTHKFDQSASIKEFRAFKSPRDHRDAVAAYLFDKFTHCDILVVRDKQWNLLGYMCFENRDGEIYLSFGCKGIMKPIGTWLKHALAESLSVAKKKYSVNRIFAELRDRKRFDAYVRFFKMQGAKIKEDKAISGERYVKIEL